MSMCDEKGMEWPETLRKKAVKLLESNRIKKELETDRRVHFSVQGETEEHSVIYDKLKDDWVCDCRYWSLRQKTCSHIIAAQLKMKMEEKRSETS